MSSDSMPTRTTTTSSLAGVAAQLAFALVALGVLVYASLRDVDALVVALAAAAVVALLFLFALRPRRTAFAGATTDAITGLGNDSELVKELDRRLADPDPMPTLLLTFDLYGFKAYNDDFGRDAGNAMLARLGEKLTEVAAPDGTVFRRTGDEFCLVAPVGEGDAELLIEEATAALSEHGDGFRIGCSFGGVLLPYEVSEPQAALRLADERLAGHRRSKQGIRTLSALVAALSERSGAVALESRVESLSVAIGGLLGVHGDRLEALARAAKLHDLGELSIPSEILDKPGPLDEQEWEFVRQQTLVAEHILNTSPELRGVAPVVRATHENWDGTGYPDGRVGEDIPLAARIIRVCHAFDAMVSARPYRPALSPENALAELEGRVGTSFDPAVVRVLSALVRTRDEGLRAA
jgi:two-component system cell cycle response regulator